jgi:hypothetical protein
MNQERETSTPRTRKKVVFCYLFAMVVVVIVYGAIPFLATPTLEQNLWMSGFAQSFLNAGWPSVKAINFGIPGAMPIPFGLAGAFLQSSLMFLFRLHPGDAYSVGAVLWLGLALAGCSGFVRMLGASAAQAPLFSLIFLTLPVVWWHATYSMLSFGFALLPLYLLTAYKLIYLFEQPDRLGKRFLISGGCFVLVSLLAIFMDGYTCVMFFTASSIIYLAALIRKDLPRIRQIVVIAPVLALAAITAGFVYTHYIGKPSFRHMPMDFFRGWGVDIVMMLIPSREVSWLMDLLHLSVPRSEEKFFGDGSVWMTTFCAPLLIVGLISLIYVRRNRYALSLVLIALFGFYFSLGPSLKINSLRPPKYPITGQERALMPEHLAIGATGNGFLYEHLPGMKSMRSTYRWSGLLFLGLFGLTVLWLKQLEAEKRRHLAYAIPILLILVNLPNLPDRLDASVTFRNELARLDADLKPMSDLIGRDRRAVFYPQGNDFMVNYLSARGNFYTYNIGGDKNVDLASESWFASIHDFFSEPIEEFAVNGDQRIAEVLNSGDTDCVVLPLFDMYSNAHQWPPDPGLVNDLKGKYAIAIGKLAEDPRFIVKNEKFYSIISLTDPAKRNDDIRISPGQSVTFKRNASGTKYLSVGWWPPEEWGTWANGELATLRMKVEDYPDRDLTLRYEAKALVSKSRPLQTVYCYVNRKLLKFAKYKSLSPTVNHFVIPHLLLNQMHGIMEVEFRAGHLHSPAELGIGDDTTIHGIGLVSLTIE